MKKLVFLFASLFLFSGLMAQHRLSKTVTNLHQVKAVHPNNRNANPKMTPASVIFSEDFAGGLPAGWMNVDSGASVASEIWTYTTVGASSGEQLNATGTTAANGYMIFDSDFYIDSTHAENADLVTPAINCSGHNSVFLSLNEYFVQFDVSTGIISVSNDSVNWTEFHHAETGLASNDATPNPNNVIVDISSVAANQSHVYVRFNYRGQYDYYWMIDDVTIYEPSTIDGGVTSINYPFTASCLTATEPVNVSIKNFGSTAISNFPVSFMVNGGTPTTETVTTTIAPGTSYDYTFNATVNLSAYSNYTIAAFTGITGDGVAANDTSSIQISNSAPQSLSSAFTMDFEPFEDLSLWEVEDANLDGITYGISTTLAESGTQCARVGAAATEDDWLYTPCLNLVAGSTYALTYWYMDFNVATACGFEVKIGAGQNSAAMTQTIIQHAIPTDTLYHEGTPTFTVPTTGAYNIGFHAYSSNPSSSFRLDNINLTDVTAIKENKNAAGVSLYPNPTTGILNLSVKKYSNAVVQIYNVVGAEIFSQTLNSADRLIDLSKFENGLYFVKITSPDFSYNQKITLLK